MASRESAYTGLSTHETKTYCREMQDVKQVVEMDTNFSTRLVSLKARSQVHLEM